MEISTKLDLKLKIGNLFLALLLSTFPTSITIGILTAHGHLVCRDMFEYSNQKSESILVEGCREANNNLILKYLIFIWLIITIPTWRWFYIGHYQRLKNS